MRLRRAHILRGNGADNWLRFARLPGFAFMVCLAALMLFAWPLISSGIAWSMRSLFNFYFLIWAALILIILLISLAAPTGSAGSQADQD